MVAETVSTSEIISSFLVMPAILLGAFGVQWLFLSIFPPKSGEQWFNDIQTTLRGFMTDAQREEERVELAKEKADREEALAKIRATCAELEEALNTCPCPSNDDTEEHY